MLVLSIVEAKIYPMEGFPQFDSAYEGFATEVDDKLYFGLCTHKNNSAGVFSFDIKNKKIKSVLSIDEIPQLQPQLGFLPQGKIHTKMFLGGDSNLYFGTHFAYPDCIPQKIDYEGGHIIAFNPETREFVDHGPIIKGEGILTMIVDKRNMHCYMLTAPSFYFIDYDLIEKKINYISMIDKHSSVCRSLGLDSNGNVYGSFESFQVFKYTPRKKNIEYLKTNFDAISTKNQEWDSPKKKGANRVGRDLWRAIEFDHNNNVFYGINASDSTLFEFDVNTSQFSSIGNMQPWNNEKVYPTLTFAKHQHTYYYSPANGRFDYKLSEDIESTCALLSFDSNTREIKEHGLIYGPQGEQIYGSASAICTRDNMLYLIAAVSTDKSENGLEFQGKAFSVSLIEIDLLTM